MRAYNLMLVEQSSPNFCPRVWDGL